MEIPQQQAVPQKRIVDPDDETVVLPDPKRPALNLDKGLKAKVHKAIAIAYLWIASELKMIELKPNTIDNEGYVIAMLDAYRSITVSSTIISIIFTAHRMLRHQAAGIETSTTKSANNVNVLKHGAIEYKITNEKAASLVKSAFNLMGLKYDRPNPNDRTHWYGTAAPFLAISTMFKARRDELRLGHSNFVIGVTGTTINTNQIVNFGLTSEHHVLLEGLSLTPSRKSSVAQSLGPMTIMIMLLLQRGNEKYAKKWKDAAKRVISHIPDADDIINALSGKKVSESRELLSALADLLLITQGREACRASFPWNALATQLLTGDQIAYYLKKGADGTYPNVVDQLLPTQLIDEIDYSGKGMWKAYLSISNFDFAVPESWGIYSSQILFHSMFGTYKEDLSLLEIVTEEAHWYTRREIGNSMQGTGSTVRHILANVPRMKYYSKLKSANITGLLASANNQVTTQSVFSGKCVKPLNENFVEYLRRTNTTQNVTGKSSSALAVMLRNLIRSLDEQITKGRETGTLNVGTVSWLPITEINKDEPSEDGKIVPRLTGKMFLQN